MRGLLIGLVLALVAPAAWAQTPQQRDWCYSATASDDQTVDGCTALIQTGRETPANMADIYYNRAYAYDNKALYDQALADYNQAIALKPDFTFAYHNRGVSYRHKGLYDLAIADFTRAIALKPDYALAYKNRGLANENKGFHDPAVADFRAALKLDPNMQSAQDGLTRLGATP